MEKAPAGGAGIDRAVRAAIARHLDLTPDAVAEADDLIQLGLDSIRTMKLAGAWRKRGIAVNFALLAAHPTVDAWYALLNGADPDDLAASDSRSMWPTKPPMTPLSNRVSPVRPTPPRRSTTRLDREVSTTSVLPQTNP